MPSLARNKKVYYDFKILEAFEAGIELLGHEVKSLKTKGAQLAGAHAIIRGGEAYLVGLTIAPYQAANVPTDYDPQRTRKLLLRKKEIRYLADKTTTQRLTIVPLKLYTKRNLVKIEIALARGKRKTDKREIIKKRETQRNIERELKKKTARS